MASTRSRSRSQSKSTGRTRSRRYGQKASEKVERAMREMKRGTLRSGRSGKKVTDSKQAIAIGLSKARRAGGKVPKRSASGGGRSKSTRRRSRG
jgi:hypothetical protein